MNGPVLPGLWHMGHSFTITITVNSSPILHSLALRLWRIANWCVFLVDCSLSHLIRPLVYVLWSLLSHFSSPLPPPRLVQVTSSTPCPQAMKKNLRSHGRSAEISR